MQNICSADFFKPSTYNCDTKTQIWLSQIGDSHDNFCSCLHPYCHLLAGLFPPGHKDRDLTINQILQRDIQQCHSGGGTGGGGSGGAVEEPTIKEEKETPIENEDLTEEAIEELIAAADDAEAR